MWPRRYFGRIIKAAYDIISPQLVSFFNKLFINAEYPENWSLGYLVPIFKGGDSYQAKNYRGITLNRLTAWTEKHEKISYFQFGYQKGKSTTDCIFILHSVISKVLNSGHKLYSVFIDYEKCFDRINRLYLWQKLIAENVSTRMTNAIKAMYKTVRAAIKYNGKTSIPIKSYLGV